jgi:hypothetical protein
VQRNAGGEISVVRLVEPLRDNTEEDTIFYAQVKVVAAPLSITDASLLRVEPEFAAPLNFRGDHRCAHATTVVTELRHPVLIKAI